ncbi:pyridoxal phosphate-dependent aminotransferase [candidate division KSB1 bacterium]|nr:pyridoxal phosphate-dependent aminotransferase [candidate division KSB1 bacterium]
MLSDRIQNMTPSATVELAKRVAEFKRQGIDIVNLNVGEPDFRTPDNINDAAYRAIAEGFTKYTSVNGIYELRSAISKKLFDDNKLKYSPEEIIVSTGAKHALVLAVFSICNPGDEVIIPVPCWGSFIEVVKLAEGTPVIVRTEESNYFNLDINNIKAVLTPKTRAIIINTPNNPTGAVYDYDTLLALGQLAVQHDLYIIADEIYEKLIYNGSVHTSIASLDEEIKKRTILVNGVSKAYAMPGWRLGYAAASQEIINGMCGLQGHFTTTTNSISQRAALEALTGPQDNLANMRAEYDRRRHYMYQRLNAMPGISCPNSSGAFFFLTNVSSLYGKVYNGALIKNSVDVSSFFLEVALVAVVPGETFYASDHIRISYSNSMDQLVKGMDRMEAALVQLS